MKGIKPTSYLNNMIIYTGPQPAAGGRALPVGCGAGGEAWGPPASGVAGQVPVCLLGGLAWHRCPRPLPTDGLPGRAARCGRLCG